MGLGFDSVGDVSESSSNVNIVIVELWQNPLKTASNSHDCLCFTGTLIISRYTDFLVNEILPSGEVVHLKQLRPKKAGSTLTGTPTPAKEGAPKVSVPAIENTLPLSGETSSDDELLSNLLSPLVASDIRSLYDRVTKSPGLPPREYGNVVAPTIERSNRGKVHEAIRRIFNSKLDSQTNVDGQIIIAAMPKQAAARGGVQRPAKPGWKELGGDYLHFTLYKENKDTMESISWLSRQLNMQPKAFQFAGTKDRRGVTVQRVSVYRVFADRLYTASRSLRSAYTGDYVYQPTQLQLGDLTGNEFVITLRDCHFESAETAAGIVSRAADSLSTRGFLNYYGLQRFGTFGVSTDQIGKAMLEGDYQKAVQHILHYDAESLSVEAADAIARDDRLRAQSIQIFDETKDASQALQIMPRKFAAESNIIRHLSKQANDYQGALCAIARNLRLMYVHAYQSRVWNAVLTQRWRRHGDTIVEGDLVLLHEHDQAHVTGTDAVDADGDIIVVPASDDRAALAEERFVRARALTKDEAESGKYNIFDIVLPTPGFDVLYPSNELAMCYTDFMRAEEGHALDPQDMRRSWKDISLSGSYRKILARPRKPVQVTVQTYQDDDQQFVQTDMERLAQPGPPSDVLPAMPQALHSEEAQREKSGDCKIAVILKMQLGSSTYATMALRELMKGGVQIWKMEFSRGK